MAHEVQRGVEMPQEVRRSTAVQLSVEDLTVETALDHLTEAASAW